jgi:COP9 signalosome complex subunit 2
VWQSFKSYDEVGDPRRLVLLKYLVLASMLHQSKIDPFDSQVMTSYITIL